MERRTTIAARAVSFVSGIAIIIGTLASGTLADTSGDEETSSTSTAADNGSGDDTTDSSTELSDEARQALTVSTISYDCADTDAAVRSGEVTLIRYDVGATKGTPPRMWSDAISTPLEADTPDAALDELQQAVCQDPLLGVTTAHMLADLEVAGTQLSELNPWLSEMCRVREDAGNINDEASWFAPLIDVEDPSDEAVQAAVERNQAWQDCADRVNSLLERFTVEGFGSPMSMVNYHLAAGGLTVDGLPEVALNPTQESREALVLKVDAKTDDCLSRVGFNRHDKRPEVFDCEQQPSPSTPSDEPTDDPTEEPEEKCPSGTDREGEVKGHEPCDTEEEKCPQGTDRAGEPVNGEPCDEPNEKCPQGTDRAGEDKGDEPCDTPEEKCPSGTDSEGEPKGDEPCDREVERCPEGTDRAGEPKGDEPCDEQVELCPDGTDREGQPVNGEPCDTEEEKCPQGTDRAGEVKGDEPCDDEESGKDADDSTRNNPDGSGDTGCTQGDCDARADDEDLCGTEGNPCDDEAAGDTGCGGPCDGPGESSDAEESPDPEDVEPTDDGQEVNDEGSDGSTTTGDGETHTGGTEGTSDDDTAEEESTEDDTSVDDEQNEESTDPDDVCNPIDGNCTEQAAVFGSTSLDAASMLTGAFLLALGAFGFRRKPELQ